MYFPGTTSVVVVAVVVVVITESALASLVLLLLQDVNASNTAAHIKLKEFFMVDFFESKL